MSVKVRVNKMFEIDKELPALIEKDLPVKSGIKLRRLLKLFIDEMKVVNDQRIAVFKKHEIPIKDNRYDLAVLGTRDRDAQEAFEKDYTDLMDSEIELNWEPIKSEELGDISISPKCLTMLDDFIKD